MYILDGAQRLAPFGAIGEIYVGGPSVSNGYVGDPDLTAQRFVPDPFLPESSTPTRMYRSGDLARRLPDGCLEYVGRADKQIKLRGFRIEPGDVEAALVADPTVSVARVWLARRPSGDGALAAVVVPDAGQAIERRALMRRLEDVLPSYMIPSAIVSVPTLPRNRNGKFDPSQVASPFADGESDDSPAGDSSTVEGLFAVVLGLPRAGADTSFFESGGDSITAVRLVARLREAGHSVRVADLYRHRTPRALLEHLRSAPSQPSSAGRQSLHSGRFPATRLQRGMLMRGAVDGRAYHDTLHYTFDRRLDVGRLREAIQQCFAAHAALRSAFRHEAGRLNQVVGAVADVTPVVEARELTAATERSRALAQWEDAQRQIRFDIGQAPLARFAVHVWDEGTVLSVFVHHAILDGWSVATLIAEIRERYIDGGASNVGDDGSGLLAEYALLESTASDDAVHREFWRRYLSGATPICVGRVRTASTRLAERTTYEVPIAPEHVALVQEQALSLGVSVKSVYLAVHVAVLGFLYGRDEVVTGTILHGRVERSGGDAVLGLFLNTVPMRVRQAESSFSDLVRQIAAEEALLVEHRRYPLERIQHTTGIADLSQVAFNFTDFHVFGDQRAGDPRLVDFEYKEETEFNFLASVHKNVFGVGVRLHISTRDTGGRAGIERAYARLFLKVIAELEGLCGDISDAIERFAEPMGLCEPVIRGAAASSHRPLVPWFAAVARERDRAVAVISGAAEVSFSSVAQRVVATAEVLKTAGVRPRDSVAVRVARGTDSLVALLAVWAVRGVYVPLAEEWAPARRAAAASAAGCALWLVSSGTERIDEGVRTVHVVESVSSVGAATSLSALEAEPHACDDDPAYVIFTSGSTGTPRGVVVPHRAISNLIAWQVEQEEIPRHPRVAHVALSTFDIAFQELLTGALAGGTIVVATEEQRRSPPELLALLREHRVEVLFTPPVLLQQLAVAREAFQAPFGLRTVITAGEELVITREIRALAAASDLTLINQYGPTETHVVTSYTLGSDSMAWPERPPIGWPIANVALRVAGPAGGATARGAEGQAIVSGSAIGLGYLDTAGGAAVSWVETGGYDGTAYSTGDFVRLGAAGLVFLGRRDQQTKIRGYRVEPGEVASVLRRDPMVFDCVVAAFEERGQKQLAAYLVLAELGADVEAILERAQAVLPEYSVPRAVRTIEAVPVTIHGKVDYGALPVPQVRRARPTGALEANAEERRLLDVWATVLGAPVESPDVSFFDAGGDSLAALDLYLALRAELGGEFPMTDLFTYPSARAFAAHRAQSLRTPRSERTGRRQFTKLRARARGSRERRRR